MTMGAFLSLDVLFRSELPSSLCCCHRWRPLRAVRTEWNQGNGNHQRSSNDCGLKATDLHRHFLNGLRASHHPMPLGPAVVALRVLFGRCLPGRGIGHGGVESGPRSQMSWNKVGEENSRRFKRSNPITRRFVQTENRMVRGDRTIVMLALSYKRSPEAGMTELIVRARVG